MSSRYLYGASVQGIQGFIFETNKLKEIAGASELVEQVCTTLFYELAKISDPKEDNNLQLAAAGNIKYLFDGPDALMNCQQVVRDFPRAAMNMAPGITVSQAVVKIEGDFASDAAKFTNELERKLRAQRSRQPVQHGLGWMVSERSRRTGKPGVDTEKDKKTALSAGQVAKRNFVADGKRSLLAKLMPETDGKRYHDLFASDMEDIASKEKAWIAVIHADGNDLGKKIMKMADGKVPSSAFRDMSKYLGDATEAAAKHAFDIVVRKAAKGGMHPIRPIVLGGDDLTVIIRGDLALDFTQVFLQSFEENTRKEFKNFARKYKYDGFSNGLTACAGIAYIKPNYPFHYGSHLADTLCGQAKKVAKKLIEGVEDMPTPSCLLFHKVHASFVEDYGSIIDKELTANGVRLDYGPYFLAPQTGYATLDDLNHWVGTLQKADSPRSRLRNWLTDLQSNPAAAKQQLHRIRQVTRDYYVQELRLKTPTQTRGAGKDLQTHTHLYDAIALTSIESRKESRQS